MVVRSLSLFTAPILVFAWSSGAAAFRVCDTENSYAFSAATQYVVGEIAFDETTGLASGTETTYNFANRSFEDFTVCHVTYELTGNYEPVTRTFLLDARRTNFSDACPSHLIEFEYPNKLLYGFQMNVGAAGSAEVRIAASGEFFANGHWGEGRTVYRTSEKCTIF